MMPLRSLPLALTATFLLATAACDDGTSPVDLGGLDAVEVTAAVDALVAPLQASAEARSNLRMALPDLQDAGVMLQWGSESAGERFPAVVAGRTFAYESSASNWEIVESREDAPANGVRVLWYPLDGSGRVVGSSPESGYVDLQPGEDGSLDPVVVRVVRTSEEGSTALLDLVQGHALTGADVKTESFEATGVYTDGATAVNFDFASTETANETAGDASYSLEATLRDTETRYHVDIAGAVDGATRAFDDLLTVTVERGGGTTVMEVRFQGSQGTQQDVTGTVRHGGTEVARVRLVGGRYEFTAPNGDPLPAGQAAGLNRMFETLTLNWYRVLYELPLFFLL